MLYKEKQYNELYFMKHRHDDPNPAYDYENNLFDKTLSPYIYQNDTMSNFLKRLQKLMSLQFDQMNLIKNWKNYMVDRYEYRHKK